MSNYEIKEIYQGGLSSFKGSERGLVGGYNWKASNIGAPTNPMTANQIKEVSSLLRQGIIPIEIGAIKSEVFDQIPKEHFKEINRMAKLSGAKISIHAPLIEPSGMTQDGWDESERKSVEREFESIVDKASETWSKKNDTVPITIHASNLPGTEFEMTPEGKKIKKLVVVDRDSGKIVNLLTKEKRYHLGQTEEELKRGSTIFPEERLEALNGASWEDSLSQLLMDKKGKVDDILGTNEAYIEGASEERKKIDEGKVDIETLRETYPGYYQSYRKVQVAGINLQNIKLHLDTLFEKAYKLGDKNQRKELIKISENFRKDLIDPKLPVITRNSEAIQKIIISLREVGPQLYAPMEEFAIGKSAETFSNIALYSFEKYKEKAPIISIENIYPGMGFSMGKNKNNLPAMSNLLEDSRNKFIEKAMNSGYSEREAKKGAEKMLGITFDVGHLNLAKKNNFKDKDLLKEFQAISKYVKHVHLTDNFGYSDSHLPAGSGNVPFKLFFEELKKKGFKGRGVVEAGGFVQQFGYSPYKMNLKALGASFYSGAQGPYWDQAMGLQQNYFSYGGDVLPQINYETFGTTFSRLPTELGGSLKKNGSRMSGTPLE